MKMTQLDLGNVGRSLPEKDLEIDSWGLLIPSGIENWFWSEYDHVNS